MNLFEEVARRAAAGSDGGDQTIPSPDRDAYRAHCRPALAERLTAIGLDHSFIRAEGDRLTYERDGVRQEVLDMVGGAGSTLFGHNNAELTSYARFLLSSGVPRHAQVSNRAYAGMLAARISEKLEEATGHQFYGSFASTGTEAVEAAIAHAQMELASRRERLLSAMEKEFAQAIHAARGRGFTLPADTAARLEPLIGSGVTPDPVAIHIRLQELNREALSGQPRLLAVRRSFHGMTTGSLSLTYNADMREPFGAPHLCSSWLPHDDAAAAARIVSGEVFPLYSLAISAQGELALSSIDWCNVLAIFVEPIQGEGGVHPLDSIYLGGLRKLADDHGFPIVVDEIQSGMGRCGTFTASEGLGLRGDYYLFAKALGGGLAKVAAIMIDCERYQENFGWVRGSTFAEDEFGCLLALKTLEIYDRDRIASRSAERGRYFLERLRALKERYPEVVRDVRGTGLMIGFELADQSASPSRLFRVASASKGLGPFASGYLFNEENVRVMNTSSSPNTLRIEPSAYIEMADMDRTVAALERVCRIIECANGARLIRHLVGQARGADASQFVEDWRDRQNVVDEEPLPGEPRVAFIGYPVESWRLSDWDPSLRSLPPESYEELLEAWYRVVPPQITQRMRVRIPGGRSVHMTYIALLLSSEMFEREMQAGRTDWLRDQIDEAVELAVQEGCRIVGFGGLTSVVTHNCRKAARHDVALTTGNALTAGMGIEAILSVSHGIDLPTSRAAVVGAAGNIASVYARMLAPRVAQIVLVGRKNSASRLQELSWRIYEDAWDSIRAGGELSGVAAAVARTQSAKLMAGQTGAGADAGRRLAALIIEELGDRAPVLISDDLGALSECRVIVSASNSTSPIIFPEHLGAGPAVICDIAVPADVSELVTRERPDVTVLVGGAVRIPGNEHLKTFASPLPEGHMYACMAETVLLGLMEHHGNFSFGDIEPSQVEAVMRAARAHQFQCGDVRTE
jgi:acetylornithine/succinyldiaminopimelate/putrescine aminotransferase/predicted amino acid dehydrogenase